MQSNRDNFIKTAFLSLTPEQFTNAVRIFQEKYMHQTVVNVDGTNDLGKDVVVYQDKKELKRCVQISVEKDIPQKLKKELPKVKRLVDEFGYSPNYLFFCSQTVSEGTIEEIKKHVRDGFGIEIDIYDGKRLSQLPCQELRDYIFGLYEDRHDQKFSRIAESEQMLFSLLTSGNSSGDIKKSLIHSMIVFAIFEKTVLEISQLKIIVEKRIKKPIPNIQAHISELLQKKQLRYVGNGQREVELTEDVHKKISDIYSESQLVEADFNFRFKELLDKYGILEYEAVMDKLQRLYSTNYQYDIDETNQSTPDFDKRKLEIYNEFEGYLKNLIADISLLPSLIEDIKALCDTNSYLNKSMAGSAFISLYSSDKLEEYINNKKKWVFFDTPVFVYFICSKICEDFNVEWKNLFYNSTKSLTDLEKNQKSLSFFVSSNYIMEAVGQLSKAVNIGWLEDINLNEEFGESRNTFYQCYKFIKANAYLDDYVKMDSFDDFIDYLGIDCPYPDTNKFKEEAFGIFSDIAEENGISIIYDFQPERYEETKKKYEMQLAHDGRNKSPFAVQSDVKQTLYLLDGSNFIDNTTGNTIEPYLATWDESFFALRATMLADPKYHYTYFYVQNPSKLANKFAIESFNIDVSCISNDIFMYAEKEYQITTKVRNLIDLISQVLKSRDNKSVRLLGWLRKIRRNEIEMVNKPSNFQVNQGGIIVAIDEVMNDLLRYMRSRIHRDMFDKFAAYLVADENYDSVVKLFEVAINAKNNHETHSIGDEFMKKIQE